jgi:hypothetical protein
MNGEQLLGDELRAVDLGDLSLVKVACRPAPARSANQSLLRSRVTVLFPKRAVLLNCRSSSTHGPMSLPSNWKWIETSESLVAEILSTGGCFLRRLLS